VACGGSLNNKKRKSGFWRERKELRGRGSRKFSIQRSTRPGRLLHNGKKEKRGKFRVEGEKREIRRAGELTNPRTKRPQASKDKQYGGIMGGALRGGLTCKERL